MPTTLLELIETTKLDAEEIAARTKQIHAALLDASEHIDAPNFHSIHVDDLELLFDQYDALFFQSQIRNTLGTRVLNFGLSNRMTSSGGATTYYADGHRPGRWFEITVSTTILFQCFADGDQSPIKTSGILCRDRLDALQRVMEHEIVHLIEGLLWGNSSCSKPRFHSISLRFFGHTENKHKLITPRKRAQISYGIQPGTRVRFRFDGTERVGIVNRITKRATVLVEDGRGRLYSDGKRYAKFYVPIQMLEAVE